MAVRLGQIRVDILNADCAVLKKNRDNLWTEAVPPTWRENTMTYLIVFFGGGIGAALRHGVNLASARLLGAAFPYATMIENISGSFLIGVVAGYFAFHAGGSPQHWQLFLTTGLLGGYTTFSAFSLDAVLLYERGALALAALYVFGSVGLSIAGLVAGLVLSRHAF
jgi:CrcB protein